MVINYNTSASFIKYKKNMEVIEKYAKLGVIKKFKVKNLMMMNSIKISPIKLEILILLNSALINIQ